MKMEIKKEKTSVESLHLSWKMLSLALLFSLGIVFSITCWIPYIQKYASFGWDWLVVFRPAIMATLYGGSPYAIDGFFSPPWLLVIMAPFVLLPSPLDIYAIIAVSICVFVFVFVKLKAPLWLIPLFFLTPQIWWSILDGNVDFLVTLGFILPPQIGLILVLLKPQLGAAIALFWIVESFRNGGIKELLKTCAPVSVIIVLSFLVLGWWPAYMDDVAVKYWNVANWPYMLPFALLLLYRAIRDRKRGLAITAGPFLSPYLHAQSLPLAVFGLLPNEIESSIAIVSLWIIWFFRGII